MKEQRIICKKDAQGLLVEYLKAENVSKVFLVCSNTEFYQRYYDELKSGFELTVFDDFTPNPDVNEVSKGVEAARAIIPDAVISLGGGSAIDTAKCIKYYINEDIDSNIYKKAPQPNSIKLVAIPTTAGTGSESTTFAVLYVNGEKYSIDSEELLPDLAVLDAGLLATLPIYPRKAAMLDVLCHAVEAYWSVNSNAESRAYSLKAIKIIREYYRDYISCDEHACEKMLVAANYGGKAINIAKTTAAHALSYKLTSRKGMPHGIAAFMCLIPICRMIDEKSKSATGSYNELLSAFEVESFIELSDKFAKLKSELELDKTDVALTDDELDGFIAGVNTQRLKNFPVELTAADIEKIYKSI